MAQEAETSGLVIDPLRNLNISAGSYDITRKASVYFDASGVKCWTKAWFNNKEKGEPSKEISRHEAIDYVQDRIGLDDWLTRHYPKQMSAYQEAISKTTKTITS
ncbi:MAG: hypothetical protein ACI3ZD_09225 [Prevotella sp.]